MLAKRSVLARLVDAEASAAVVHDRDLAVDRGRLVPKARDAPVNIANTAGSDHWVNSGYDGTGYNMSEVRQYAALVVYPVPYPELTRTGSHCLTGVFFVEPNCLKSRQPRSGVYFESPKCDHASNLKPAQSLARFRLEAR